MKRFLITALLITIALPTFATCPIDGGACTALSNFDGKSLQQKYLPDRMQEIQKPNAFQPTYVVPYHSELINTDSNNDVNPPTNDYNSNCQFGVCLPGVEPEGSLFE